MRSKIKQKFVKKGKTLKKSIKVESVGEFTYEEGFWTGKKDLSLDGKALEKTSKTTFKTAEEKVVEVQGNFLMGANLKVDNQTYELYPVMKWYEYLLTVLPFIIDCVWGNLIYLCDIVPIVGGLIGGLISGLMSFLNILFIKMVKPFWLKILITLGVSGLTFLLCYLVGLIF